MTGDDTHVRQQDLMAGAWPAEVDEAVVATALTAQGMAGKSLNPQQREACEVLLAGRSVLVSGKAGTGKSTTLHVLRALSTAAGKKVMVLAPSGVAAQLVGGRTIHSGFGLSPEISFDALAERSEPQHPMPLDVLIVDEISMVKADVFDAMDVDLRRLKKQPDKPMGGVQVVLLGDSLQLPPVHKEPGFNDDLEKQAADRYLYEEFFRSYRRVYFDSARVWPSLNQVLDRVDLEQVERQSGDDALVSAFNEIRTGLVTAQSWELLDSLVTDVDVDTAVAEGATALAYDNKTVDRVNAQALRGLGTPILYLPWEVEGSVTSSQEKDVPFVAELRVAVGARVMMTVNDANLRFFNGTFGRVVAASEFEIRVELDNLADPAAPGSVIEVDRHSFEITRKVFKQVPGELPGVKSWQDETVGEIRQFPVRLAWAITVHRAQGKTLDKCYLENPVKMDGAGQLYVALSRVKSREGLQLSEPIDRLRYQPPMERVRQENLLRRRAAGITSAPEGLAFIGVCGYGLARKSRVLSLSVMILRDNQWVWDMQTLICPVTHLDKKARLHGRTPAAYEFAMAPTLAEVWTQLATRLQGCQVVTVDGWMLEFELHRSGISAGMALGVAVDAGDAQVVGSAVGLPDMDAGVEMIPVRDRVLQAVAAYRSGALDMSGGLPVQAEYVQEVLAAIATVSPVVGGPGGPDGADRAEAATGVSGASALEPWPGPVRATGEAPPPAVIDGEVVTDRPVGQRAEVLMERARRCSSWNEWTRQRVVDHLCAQTGAPVEQVSAQVPVADEIDLESLLGAGRVKAKVGLVNYVPAQVRPVTDKLGLELVHGNDVTKRECAAVIMEDTSQMGDKQRRWRRMGIPLVDRRLFLRWALGREAAA